MLPGQAFTVQDPSNAAPQAGGILMADALGLQAKIDGGPDTLDFEQYVPLDEKRYDVTNNIESGCKLCLCPCCGWTTKTLTLLDQEVFLREKDLCNSKSQRRPYAQLGSVDKFQTLCCVTFSSAFAPVVMDDKGNPKGGISPGFGCDEALVMEIVKELQSRKEKRGNIAQIRKLEYMIEQVLKLAKQVPLYLDGLGEKYESKYPPDFTNDRKVYDTKSYDVAHCCEKIGCTGKELVLGPEEATLTTNKCFGMSSFATKREYAELGHVEKKKVCICCAAMDSDLTPEQAISPGLGCDKFKVSQIVQEMRDRLGDRGDVGQIRRQEKMFRLLREIDYQFPKIRSKLNVEFPPSQETMATLYNSNPPNVSLLREQGVGNESFTPEKAEVKEYDITNFWESCSACVFTCGTAGWTTKKMELQEEYVVTSEKNNFDDSNIVMPYAQLDNVDFTKSCCCCFSVNDESPGCGCSGSLVEELAKELQARKVKRGTIAQIKQLEAMQSTSLELDCEVHATLLKQGLQYPPAQETIQSIYKGVTPKILLLNKESPHVGATEQFEMKIFDITNLPESICGLICCPCGGWTKKTMFLEAEEMYIKTENLCLLNNQRTPYGKLGAVETEVALCCCHQLPDVATPGCGCSKDYVDQIASELQQRKVKRGNIAQIMMMENVMNELLKLGVKMDLLLDQKNITYPPSQEVMARLFVQGKE
jgi:hypothetical protein